MESLRWVDSTYIEKHKSDHPEGLRALYYPHLRMYSVRRDGATTSTLASSLKTFVIRYGRRTATSLAVYLLSLLPVVGIFVIPAASFYAFNKGVGPIPAVVIFGSGLVVPKRIVVMFLQSYFSSRSLMRELVRRCRYCFVHLVLFLVKNCNLFHLILEKFIDNIDSLNHISLASNTRKNKKGSGFVTEPVFFLDLRLVSTLCLQYLSLEF